MPRLFLLRHAKSSWALPGQRDFDRPLNDRGRAAAPLIGRFMAENGHRPERVLCSPAARTRGTLDGIRPFLPASAAVEFVRELYEASVEGVLRAIAAHAGGAGEVLVIGHNPSIHMLALALTRDGEAELGARLRSKYPTAALTAIDVAGDSWSAIRPGGGTLIAFVTPSDLGGEGGDD